MKKIGIKIGIIILILCSILIHYSKTFATERLVDIPVPENSSGYADFTPEEAEEEAKEYENSIKNTTENKDREANKKESIRNAKRIFLCCAGIIIVCTIIKKK